MHSLYSMRSSYIHDNALKEVGPLPSWSCLCHTKLLLNTGADIPFTLSFLAVFILNERYAIVLKATSSTLVSPILVRSNVVQTCILFASSIAM